jgi:hypothetical protein
MRPQWYLYHDNQNAPLWWEARGPTENASMAKPFRSKFAAEQYAREMCHVLDGASLADQGWIAVKENTEDWK